MKKLLGIVVLGLLLSTSAYSEWPNNGTSVFDHLDYGMTKKQVRKISNTPKYNNSQEFNGWLGVSLCFKGYKDINKYYSNFKTEITTHYNPELNANIWYVFENVTDPIKTKFGACRPGNGTLKALAFSKKEAIDVANISFVVNHSNFKSITKKVVRSTSSSNASSTSNSSSANTNDKIAQSKQICKDLGFKTNTEKFADCALKMMSMNFEATNKVASSSGGTTQQIIVQQPSYDIWDALLDMSFMLQNNNTSSSSGSSGTRCVVNRTNSTTGQTVMNCY